MESIKIIMKMVNSFYKQGKLENGTIYREDGTIFIENKGKLE